MPYATTYPAENASFNAVAFFENISTRHPVEAERTVIGQTVVGRYVKPAEIQITGYAGSSEASSLRSAVNSSATLVWSGGSQSAYLTRAETTYDSIFALYYITLTFIL